MSAHPVPVSLSQKTSVVQVTRNGAQSRLTACRAIAPLKIINPRVHHDYCAVVLSSYGGGMVEGDRVDLQVRCEPHTLMYLGTQALTRVYKSPNGIPCVQTVSGFVGSEACAVVLLDPVVPFANSIFRQEQHWHLEPDACLVLADGHTAGRRAFGEAFDYTAYTSHITVTTPDRPILIERYHSEPDQNVPTMMGAFGDYDVVFQVFIAGTPDEPRYTHLVSYLQGALAPFVSLPLTNGNAPQPPGDLLLSYAQARPQLFVIRALSKGVDHLAPLYQAIGKAISHPSLLNDNPLSRKY